MNEEIFVHIFKFLIAIWSESDLRVTLDLVLIKEKQAYPIRD